MNINQLSGECTSAHSLLVLLNKGAVVVGVFGANKMHGTGLVADADERFKYIVPARVVNAAIKRGFVEVIDTARAVLTDAGRDYLTC